MQRILILLFVLPFIVACTKITSSFDFERGKQYYDNGDIIKAVEYFEKAAKKGFAPAQNNLAVCYMEGEGVEKNDSLAFVWYQKAAKQGLAEAQYSVGECYIRGVGVEYDIAKTIEWWIVSTKNGDKNAPYKLALLYYTGGGVEQNEEIGNKYMKIAAERGNVDAIDYFQIINAVDKVFD